MAPRRDWQKARSRDAARGVPHQTVRVGRPGDLPATAAQLRYLRALGVEVPGVLNRRQAGELIDRRAQRRPHASGAGDPSSRGPAARPSASAHAAWRAPSGATSLTPPDRGALLREALRRTRAGAPSYVHRTRHANGEWGAWSIAGHVT